MIDRDEAKTTALGVAGGLLLAVLGFKVFAFAWDIALFLLKLALANLGVVILP
jgi:hypothetical protein